MYIQYKSLILVLMVPTATLCTCTLLVHTQEAFYPFTPFALYNQIKVFIEVSMHATSTCIVFIVLFLA